MATLAELVAQFPATTPDHVVAASLNSTNEAAPFVSRPVPAADARRVLYRSGEWGAVCIAGSTNSTATLAVRSAAILLHELFTREDTVDTVNVPMRQRLAATINTLVTAGVLLAATRDELIALADRRPTYAEANNLPTITARDVGLARGAKGGAA
jgi:hypothetical protein